LGIGSHSSAGFGRMGSTLSVLLLAAVKYEV
jgi:hypothetical protein